MDAFPPRSPISLRFPDVSLPLTAALLAAFLPGVAAAVAPPPTGVVESPRLGSMPTTPSTPADRGAGTAENLDRRFTFKGWVDFPPGAGELWMYVGCDGDSFPGNGELRVKIFKPSATTQVVAGRPVWRFKLGAFKPFRAAVDLAAASGVSCARPWQDGGTARLSLFAYRYSDGSTGELTYTDRFGVAVRFHDLIFSDPDMTPVTQSFYTEPLYPVPAFLGRRPTGSPSNTQYYYRRVLVNSDGTGNPVVDTIEWALPTLREFRDRYFGVALNTCQSPKSILVSFPPAVYFNKGDLGIGREMHCSYNDCSKETACYVKNYGRVDDATGLGVPLFSDDKAPSKAAFDAERPFATVAMVSRGKMARGAPNKVFFAVYGGYNPADPKASGEYLVYEAPLDDRQFNKFIPGNCLVCHGTSSAYDFSVAAATSASFLPFDLEHAIGYYAQQGALSRSAQEDKFRLLNQIVAKTDFYSLEGARTMLNGFYGSDFNTEPADWQSRTFRDKFVPDGWNSQTDARRIYKEAIAPYCRSCHITHATRDFATWDNFVMNQFDIRTAVCRARGPTIMPNAQVTLQRFWHSDARAQLVSRANGPGCGLEPF